jgi:hypothetical protein
MAAYYQIESGGLAGLKHHSWDPSAIYSKELLALLGSPQWPISRLDKKNWPQLP